LKNGKGGRSVSKEAWDKLMAYDWPGNVREPKNVVNRAAILCESPCINADDIHIPSEDSPQESDWLTLPYDITLDEAEKIIIQHMLKIYEGNKRKVADVLKISIATLYNKIKLKKG
jgi:DNA-binding NtrC family response regulator